MIEFQCSGCGKRLRVSDDKAGKKGKGEELEHFNVLISN